MEKERTVIKIYFEIKVENTVGTIVHIDDNGAYGNAFILNSSPDTTPFALRKPFSIVIFSTQVNWTITKLIDGKIG